VSVLEQETEKRRRGAPDGNKNAMKHGLDADHASTDPDTAMVIEQIVLEQGGQFDLFQCLRCGDRRSYPREQYRYRCDRGPAACAACGATHVRRRRALRSLPPLPYLHLSLIRRYVELESRIARAEAWFDKQPAVGSSRSKSLLPAFEQLQRHIDSAVRIAGMLGIERVERRRTLEDVIAETRRAAEVQQNSATTPKSAVTSSLQPGGRQTAKSSDRATVASQPAVDEEKSLAKSRSNVDEREQDVEEDPNDPSTWKTEIIPI
jgi:hypothetical protein